MAVHKYLISILLVLLFLAPRQQSFAQKISSSAQYVQDIKINGFSAGEVLDMKRAIHFQKGQIFKQIDLTKDSALIEKALFDKGYTKAKVQSAQASELEKGQVQIVFKVWKGPLCRIDQVVVAGSSLNILNFLTLPIESGAACDLRSINDTLAQNQENLVEQGYLNAKIRIKEMVYSRNKENAKVVLQIDKGPHTSIEIVDTQSSLLDLDFLKSKMSLTYSDILLLSDADLRMMLENYYQKQGYPYVKVVGPKKIIDQRGNTVIRFSITKGTFVKVGKISFIGVLPLPEKQVIKKMGLSGGFFSSTIPFMQQNLPIYREKLLNICLENGYLDAQVSEPDYIPFADNTVMDLVFRLEKGKQYLIKNIHISDLPDKFKLDAKSLSAFLAVNSPMSPEGKSKYIEEFRNQLINNGYLYGKVTVAQEVVAEKRNAFYVTLYVKVESDTIVRVRNVYAEGDMLGKTDMILSIADLKGKVFNQENIDAARDRILRHNIFSSIVIEPVDFNVMNKKVHEIDLVIRVRARTGYTLGFSPGWGNLRGYIFGADYTLNKITSDGLRFVSSAALSQERQQQNFATSNTSQILGKQLSLGLTEPLLKIGPLVTPLDVSVIAGYQVTAQTLTNRQILSLKLISDWKPNFFNWNWDFSVALMHEDSNSTSSESAIVQTLDSPSIVIREVAPGVSLDMRNNSAWPTSGGFYSFQVGFARFGFDSQVQYNRFKWTADYFFPIYGKLSGAILVGGININDTVNRNGTTVTPPGSQRATLTENALIRGFPETYGSTAPGPLLWLHYLSNGAVNCNTQLASIGSTNLMYVKAETRYRFNDLFGMVFFMDTGESFFTDGEISQIRAQINNQIKNQGISTGSTSTQCFVDQAALINSFPTNMESSNFLDRYWKQAYVSIGTGLRVIFGNYATLSLDYGYPIKDPSSEFGNCPSPQEATNMNTPPPCVSRMQESSYLSNAIQFRGAFHLGIAARL